MCLDDVIQQPSGQSFWVRVLLKSGSSLGPLLASRFILSMSSRCWVQFDGVCKAGRL